jgi:hypothetical protein
MKDCSPSTLEEWEDFTYPSATHNGSKERLFLTRISPCRVLITGKIMSSRK